jgi:hypothetical protein
VDSSVEEELSSEEEALSSAEDTDSSAEAVLSSIETAESPLASMGADSSTLLKDSAGVLGVTLVYASEEEVLLLSPLQAIMKTDRASIRQIIINFFIRVIPFYAFLFVEMQRGFDLCDESAGVRIYYYTNGV